MSCVHFDFLQKKKKLDDGNNSPDCSAVPSATRPSLRFPTVKIATKVPEKMTFAKPSSTFRTKMMPVAKPTEPPSTDDSKQLSGEQDLARMGGF
jgi:hypothetical protein